MTHYNIKSCTTEIYLVAIDPIQHSKTLTFNFALSLLCLHEHMTVVINRMINQLSFLILMSLCNSWGNFSRSMVYIQTCRLPDIKIHHYSANDWNTFTVQPYWVQPSEWTTMLKKPSITTKFHSLKGKENPKIWSSCFLTLNPSRLQIISYRRKSSIHPPEYTSSLQIKTKYQSK